MKYLIFSDSHGHAEYMRRALSLHPDAAGVWFLGDGLEDFSQICADRPHLPMLAVAGNMDGGFAAEPASRVFDIGGHRVLALHGHTASVRSGTAALEAQARACGADIALFGHTHEPYLHYEGGEAPLWLFNPGSIGHPYDGVHRYGLLEIRGDALLFSHGIAD